jgi:endogenous inhibitor of DNA gyrase (YacG/DUF329 family)
MSSTAQLIAASAARFAASRPRSHTPFCSQGCRDRDLLNWLGDAYRVPGPLADPAEYGGGEEPLDRER